MKNDLLLNELLIFLPGADADGFDRSRHEGFDVGERKAGVGQKWNIMVDGVTADVVSVGQFAFGVILGNVDDEVDCVFADDVEHRQPFFVGPADLCGFYAVG